MSDVTPHPRNPLTKVAEFYQKMMVMAEARKLTRTESELLTSLMIASCQVAAGPDPRDRMAAAVRIQRQATEFLEMGMVPEPEPPPVAA
ncbi:MAG: hypothetical protein K2Y51_26085 [Gammaproteobacteria bacterium]|nr:hypothetical protein [Gammaproteobacteria bacterium]